MKEWWESFAAVKKNKKYLCAMMSHFQDTQNISGGRNKAKCAGLGALLRYDSQTEGLNVHLKSKEN